MAKRTTRSRAQSKKGAAKRELINTGRTSATNPSTFVSKQPVRMVEGVGDTDQRHRPCGADHAAIPIQVTCDRCTEAG